MKKTQEQKEIKAENLVDNFVKEWRVKNNTEDAVYSHYHYDAMIAFAEYFNELINQNKMTAVKWLQIKMATSSSEEMVENINVWFAKAKEMEKEQMETTWNNAIDAQLKDKWDSYDDFHKTTFKSE